MHAWMSYLRKDVTTKKGTKQQKQALSNYSRFFSDEKLRLSNCVYDRIFLLKVAQKHVGAVQCAVSYTDALTSLGPLYKKMAQNSVCN